MRKVLRRVGLGSALGLVLAMPAAPCTTMQLGEASAAVLAYSYDFDTGAGALLVNPRGAAKRALAEVAPARWEARHGSVTFNQFGRGMPTAGMNEAGLTVTLMWNDAVVYPAPGEGPHVNELEFIQRLLDTAGDVDEAVARAREVSAPGQIPIHWFVADAAGGRAILAYRDGALHVLDGAAIPVPALSNSDYEALLAELPRFAGFGGARPIPPGSDVSDLEANSHARFAHAAAAIEAAAAAPGATSDDEAFAALARVRNPGTQWNVVFRPAERRIAFRVRPDAAPSRIALDEVDMACGSDRLGLRLEAAAGGPVADAVAPFDAAAHLALMEEVYPGFPPTAELPEPALRGLSETLMSAVACPAAPAGD